jgi:large repetitive protein
MMFQIGMSELIVALHRNLPENGNSQGEVQPGMSARAAFRGSTQSANTGMLHAPNGDDRRPTAGAPTRILLLALLLLPHLTAAIIIGPGEIPTATAGKPFSFVMTATGGMAPYSFSIVDGSLPPGISLSGNIISGTAPITIYGVYWIEVEARDGSGNVGWIDYFFRLFPAEITLSTTSLATGRVGARYSMTLQANGGIGPLFFVKESGDLPPGLTMTNKVIQGTPTTVGTYHFVIRVSDYFKRTGTFPVSITVTSGATALGVEPSSVPSGEANVAYVPLAFTGVGGAGNYSLVLKGNLPAGMSFTNNTLMGTPAATSGGSYPFTLEVRDGTGGLASQAYTLVIGGLTVEPSTLSSGAIGVPYGPVSFTGQGGTGTYTFSLSGSLPAGLVLENGILSGTPAEGPGSYNFSIVVHDGAGGSGTVSLSLTIAAGPDGGGGGAPVLPLSLSIPWRLGAVDETLRVPLRVSGGAPPFTYSVSAGTIPPGCALSSDGVISGIPSLPGSFTFTVTVRDSAGNTASSTAIIPINGPLTMVTASLPTLIPRIPYWARLTAAGGVPPHTWMITLGVLPAGLTLNWLTGVISGTTSETSGSYRFDVQVSDGGGATAAGSFIMAPDNTPLSIDSGRTLPPAGHQRPYKYALSGSGAPPLTWMLESGALPPGLVLSAGGEITGVPTASGVFTFSVRVMDAGMRTLSQEFTLTVNQPLRIMTAFPLPDALLGTVSLAFAAEGGVPPYSWSVSGGSLPPGFKLSSGGLLSGSTKANGAFHFEISVTDSNDALTRVPFSIRVAPVLAVESATLPGGFSDAFYSAVVSASGGTPPYRWSAKGLPPEFSLDPISGMVSGTSPEGKKIEFTVTVTDQVGSTATQGLSISIETGPLSLQTKSLPDATLGAPYSSQLAAKGGIKPYTWSIVLGGLPAGLRLAQNGTFSGTPAEPGRLSFTVVVVDAEGNSRRGEVTLQIWADKFKWEPGSLPDATLGAPYSFQFVASGGTKPYGWSVTGGAVPAGLHFSPEGVLSGIAAQAGIFGFSVTVVDAASNRLDGQVEMRVLGGSAEILTLPARVPPVSQIPVRLMLDQSVQPPVGATLELSFAGQNGCDDPAVQFSTGGRTAEIDPAAGGHAAMSIQTGSTAGTLTVQVRSRDRVDVSPHAPVVSRIEAAPPVIWGVDALRRSDGIEMVVTGYSTTREVSAATLHFEGPTSEGMQLGLVRLPVAAEFRSWFDSPLSGGFGGQFRWRRFFPASDPGAISRVSVGLESSAGRSVTFVADVR